MDRVALNVERLKVSEIFADHAFNCRGRIAPIEVVDLAKSIEQHELLEPITVQPWDKTPGKKYRIVMGHRRFLAHQVLQREEIRCFVKSGLSETDARTLNLIENISRSDLNLLQEAKALEYYKQIGLTMDETAAITNQSKGWVQTRYMVLEFPEDIQMEIAAGFLNQTQIRDISGLSRERQYEAIKDIKMRREKGDKSPVKYNPPKKKGTTKRPRSKVEMIEMLGMVMDSVGPCFGTRCLAWTCGEISDFDFQIEIKSEMEKQGKKYIIPPEYMRF